MRDKTKGSPAVTAGLMIAAAVILFPLFWALCAAFKQPWEMVQQPERLFAENPLYLANFKRALENVPFVRYFFNSFLTSFLTTAVRLAAAALAAFAFTYYDFRFRRALFLAVLCTMMIPSDVLVIANYRTVATLGLTNTYLGITVVSFIGASQMFMLRQTFRQAALSQWDAARMDGCGDMRFLFGVLLPQCRYLMATLALQVFVNQWNAYLWPLLVTDTDAMRTLQVGITMLRNAESTNYEEILAGVMLALIAPVLLIIVSRYLAGNKRNEGSLAG